MRGFAGWGYNDDMITPIRRPVVAGAFYPGRSDALLQVLSSLFGGKPQPKGSLSRPLGLVAPHAGYVYSGKVAADGYMEVGKRGRPDAVIILGTNHTGLGRPISIGRAGAWRTPLGDAPVATELADRLIERGFPVAEEAFLREHSVEVQLPFIQYLFGPEVPFIPVCVMLPPLDDLIAAGEGIAEVVQGGSILVVASSDFTHYEPDGIARRLDMEAIELILGLDVAGFYRLVIEKRLSICGAGAITILLAAAARLGWSNVDLVSYATSGDVTGDRSAVVGYAAITVEGDSR